MSRVVLVVGGARSGKSTFAERLAESANERLLYIATAQRSDAEMTARIETHVRDRERTGGAWTTAECGGAALSGVDTFGFGAVLVDCLTLWLTHVMAACGWPADEAVDAAAVRWAQTVDAAARAEMRRFLDKMRAEEKTVVLVANEVGLATCPDAKVSRVFRDVNGRVLQDIGRRPECESVFFMVAGFALDVKKLSAEATLARLGGGGDLDDSGSSEEGAAKKQKVASE